MSQAMLRVENLVKVYPTGQRALKGCNLEIDTSQVVFIIGPSGSGKSTFIRCINRLVEPTEGKVSLDGLELTRLRKAELRRARRKMGMIFQEYNLVERLSVMENVLSGRLGYVSFLQAVLRRFPQADIEEAFRLLGRVGLTGFENNRADALSGGQRQRVGIARALIQRPKILLVDEPTSSLDPKTSRIIMRLITELAKELHLPAIVNIHDVSLAQAFADRIVGLAEGEIVYDGAPDKVNAATLNAIYGEEDWSKTIRKAEDEDDNNNDVAEPPRATGKAG
jgi:phosphonate transport system ATP-binding protein